MSDWLHHPRYIPVRDKLIEHLRTSRYRFRRLNCVAFLCGAVQSPARDALRKYMQKYHSGFLTFYAEAVWDEIVRFGEQTALQMEEYLASLADIVIIISESPGTFAELGAFSLSPPLRKKLLPIVDIKYENANSFIRSGPLKWVDNESDFRPTIYVPIERILESAADLKERLERVPTPRPTKISDLTSSPKHLLFFMCDLIAVIEPATISMIHYYLEKTLSSTPKLSDVTSLVGVGQAMRLLLSKEVATKSGQQTYYYRQNPDNLDRPFHHRRIDLPSERAQQVSVLQTIEQAQELILP